MGFSGLILALVVGTVYFMPALIAWRRRAPRAGLILLANAALGWTVIGWIVLLVLALRPSAPPLGPAPG
ncbi:superinfection immunity protein [Ferrovibrio sp.]|uniref:superinfection immunity protein n=1 Tax=Ferrovibrio sp. TaxID=1917215 RepID=UPI003D1221B3